MQHHSWEIGSRRMGSAYLDSVGVWGGVRARTTGSKRQMLFPGPVASAMCILAQHMAEVFFEGFVWASD